MYVYACLCIYVYKYVCVYICIYKMCVYVYILISIRQMECLTDELVVVNAYLQSPALPGMV